MYCQSRIALRLMKPGEAEDLRAKAFAAANASWSIAYDTGETLANRGWTDLAVPQLEAFARLPPGPGGPPPAIVSNARFELASIATRDGDDEQAAADEQAAMNLLSPQEQQSLARVNPGGGPMPPVALDAINSQVHWSRLTAAKKKNDAEAIKTELDHLVALSPTNADVVQDMVPLLKAAGRDGDAQAAFSRVYGTLRPNLDADPGNAMYMNDLAWFCAQCGERLEEADDLARKAVAAAPHEAAFIDTLAFCEYRLNRFEEAVRFETIALSIDKGDFVMLQALERFRAAAANKKPS
jgi:tetratricopeptide (TPR) repeat protein